MNQKNQDRFNKIISPILLIAWCIIIFSFSNQVGGVSENSSNFIVQLVIKIFQFFGIILENTSFLSFIVRKLAHIFLYFMLYLLSFYVTKTYFLKKPMLISFIFCILYAASDEFHQLFIEARSFGIRDIFIDGFGSLCCFLIIWFKSKIGQRNIPK